jgi:adenylate cyclase
MKLRGSRAQGLLTAVAAVLSLLWGVFLGARHLDGERTVLDRVEAVSADLRFLLAGERKAPDELVIVAVDDAAIRQAGSWPVPRTVIADLVRRIAAQRPRAVAIDILFIDPGPEAADAELALALRSVPSVIAAALPEELGAGRTEGPAAPLWPNARLADAAAIGLVNVQVESGTPRHVPLLIRNGGAILPSFALRAASVALGVEPVLETDGVVLGARTVPTDLGYRLPLRFYGGRGTIRTVSAARVLGGEIEPALLRDRIVVVGVMDSTSRDTFPTPFDPHLSGAEVLATAIGHLVSGGGLIRTRTVRLVDAAATALLPVLTVLLVALRRTGIGLTLAGLVTIAWIGLTGVAFAEGTWLSVALPLAAVGPAAILYGGVRLWFDRRESKRHADAEEALRRFQPPVLAERLAEDPGFLAAPVRQDAAVVFLDLTGFTGLAETVGPERTRTLLKRFHALIEDEVTARKGLVTSFMGDGAMILFGLPDPDPNGRLPRHRGGDGPRPCHFRLARHRARRSSRPDGGAGRRSPRTGDPVAARGGPSRAHHRHRRHGQRREPAAGGQRPDRRAGDPERRPRPRVGRGLPRLGAGPPERPDGGADPRQGPDLDRADVAPG